MLPLFVKTVQLQTLGRVLDVGCGAGNALRAFRALGMNVMGLTLAPSEARAHKENGFNVLHMAAEMVGTHGKHPHTCGGTRHSWWNGGGKLHTGHFSHHLGVYLGAPAQQCSAKHLDVGAEQLGCGSA